MLKFLQTDRRTGQKLYAPDLSIRGHNKDAILPPQKSLDIRNQILHQSKHTLDRSIEREREREREICICGFNLNATCI
jgi:hypothetical protein